MKPGTFFDLIATLFLILSCIAIGYLQYIQPNSVWAVGFGPLFILIILWGIRLADKYWNGLLEGEYIEQHHFKRDRHIIKKLLFDEIDR